MGVLSGLRRIHFWAAAMLTTVTLLLVACTAGGGPGPAATASSPTPAVTTPAPASSPTPAATTPAPAATPVPLKLLQTSPEKGPVGTGITITGEGLPPGKEITFQWVTWEGTYITEASAENVRFLERKFTEQRLRLGSAPSDAQGLVTATLTVPEDYGEIHDIYATADGQDIARGGFRLLRTVTLSPTEGPVGTPITITVKGIAWKPFENTMAIRYDNRFTGFVSAITTRGTAVFQVRAAGPVGKHTVQLTGASAATPYLNYDQSPVAYIPGDFSWVFTVTKDNGPPPSSLDWPTSGRVATASTAAPRTTVGSISPAPGFSAALEPASGPILAPVTLQAKGLAPNVKVKLVWVSARGNRLSPSGWSLTETPLPAATTGVDGLLEAKFQVPDDLGGWHVVRLIQDEKTLGEVAFFVERSLLTVAPRKVKLGETFTVQIKGIGWTEMDNGVAVNYDNAYIGYACGFNTNGDITLKLMASGGPGTHLIELYPMLYRAKGNHPAEYWNFQIPQLTALEDHPGLALGYRLPIFRLAIEAVE